VPIVGLDQLAGERTGAVSFHLDHNGRVEAVEAAVAHLERASAAPRLLGWFERSLDFVYRGKTAGAGDAGERDVQEMAGLWRDPVEMGKRRLHALDLRDQSSIELEEPGQHKV